MKCEKCGKEIDSLEVDMFNGDGSDDWYDAQLYEENDVAFVNALPDWTGDELEEDEQIYTIRCPHCKKFPFANESIETCHTVTVMMFPKERKEE